MENDSDSNSQNGCNFAGGDDSDSNSTEDIASVAKEETESLSRYQSCQGYSYQPSAFVGGYGFASGFDPQFGYISESNSIDDSTTPSSKEEFGSVPQYQRCYTSQKTSVNQTSSSECEIESSSASKDLVDSSSKNQGSSKDTTLSKSVSLHYDRELSTPEVPLTSDLADMFQSKPSCCSRFCRRLWQQRKPWWLHLMRYKIRYFITIFGLIVSFIFAMLRCFHPVFEPMILSAISSSLFSMSFVFFWKYIPEGPPFLAPPLVTRLNVRQKISNTTEKSPGNSKDDVLESSSGSSKNAEKNLECQ